MCRASLSPCISWEWSCNFLIADLHGAGNPTPCAELCRSFITEDHSSASHKAMHNCWKKKLCSRFRCSMMPRMTARPCVPSSLCSAMCTAFIASAFQHIGKCDSQRGSPYRLTNMHPFLVARAELALIASHQEHITVVQINVIHVLPGWRPQRIFKKNMLSMFSMCGRAPTCCTVTHAGSLHPSLAREGNDGEGILQL